MEAAKKATACPLLENIDLQGARGILVNITADPNLGLDEYAAVGAVIEEFAAQGANVISGTVIDENAGEELRIIVVATGLGLSGSASVEHASNVAVLPVSGTGAAPDPARVPPPPGPEAEAAEKAAQRNWFDIPAYIRNRPPEGSRV